MEKEIWKDIQNFEGYYKVSNMGRVKSLKRTVRRGNNTLTIKESIMVPTPNSRGYLRVTLSKDGKRKQMFVHRLVMENFVPNSNNYPCINHKDENHINNKLENLEWCTYSYNNTYNDLHHRKMKNYNYEERNKKVDYKRINEILMQYRRKIVYQYDLEGNFIKEWKSGAEPIKAGIATKTIYDCLVGKQKQHKGYKWSYERW